MTLDTILSLAAHANITGLKDCGGDLDKTQAIIADGRLQVLAGDDAQVFHNLCLGGAGAITAAAQVRPEAFVAMYRALRAGELDQGRRQQHALAPVLQALFAQPNPCVIKAVLAQQGLMRNEVRSPMLPFNDALPSLLAT
jgi:4-hydroxy-tetrahydrodipicolinate synthase